MNTLNHSSVDNMTTNGESGSAVDIYGVHGYREKVGRDRSMCQVNRCASHFP